MTILLLRYLQVMEHPLHIFRRAHGQETAGGFGQVAGPGQVIAAQVVIAFGKTPGNRQAGNNAPGESFGLMRAQHGRADAAQIWLLLAHRLQGRKRILPGLPGLDVACFGDLKAVLQAGQNPVAGLVGRTAKTQRQHKLAVRGSQLYLASQGDVAIVSPIVAPGQLFMAKQVLPAV